QAAGARTHGPRAVRRAPSNGRPSRRVRLPGRARPADALRPEALPRARRTGGRRMRQARRSAPRGRGGPRPLAFRSARRRGPRGGLGADDEDGNDGEEVRRDLLTLAAELARQDEPFVLATVVRREAPSSAQVGDAAVVTASGEFRGWLGGSCATPTVAREAVRALADGRPR